MEKQKSVILMISLGATLLFIINTIYLFLFGAAMIEIVLMFIASVIFAIITILMYVKNLY